MKENSTLSSVIENHLKPGPWNKLKPFCTEQLDSLKFFICKYPKVFPFPCWLILVDLLIILWFMFASLHTAMISKSLKMPIPVNLNQSLRRVLDCYHWSPQSKRHSIQGRGNRRNWFWSRLSWCILWCFAQINPDDFLDWEGDFSCKEEDRLFWFWQSFPSEGIGGRGDSWVLNYWCSLLCSRRTRNCE